MTPRDRLRPVWYHDDDTAGRFITIAITINAPTTANTCRALTRAAHARLAPTPARVMPTTSRGASDDRAVAASAIATSRRAREATCDVDYTSYYDVPVVRLDMSLQALEKQHDGKS